MLGLAMLGLLWRALARLCDHRLVLYVRGLAVCTECYSHLWLTRRGGEE